MYLFKKDKEKSIIVYDFFPNNNELIELKKRYLNNIKSVILHINNEDLFSRSVLMFNELDRKEKNGKISYIEDTKNDFVITEYIYGEFDLIDPKHIIRDSSDKESIYSTGIYNEDSTVLFGGYSYHHEFVTDEGVLLTGFLGRMQPLLSADVNGFLLSDIFDYYDKEVIDFLKIFNCKKQFKISLDNLKLLQENNLITFSDDIQDTFEKSEEVLNYYNKVKKLTK